MSNEDNYQGWANRETWAFNLHWSNDQGFYNFVLDQAGHYLAEHPDTSDRGLGEAVVEFVQEELPELSPELWELMRSDVGSFWRVDHEEVGRTVREGLTNEDY